MDRHIIEGIWLESSGNNECGEIKDKIYYQYDEYGSEFRELMMRI